MSDKQRYYFQARVFGEVEANNEEMAELIVKNGISTTLRLQSEEADFDVRISTLKEDVDLEDDDEE